MAPQSVEAGRLTPAEWKAKLADPGTGFAILATWGRAGSNLLDSFFDGHPELVRLPVMLPLLTDWDAVLAPCRHDREAMRHALLERSVFARDGYFQGLGASRDISLSIPKEEIVDLALALFDASSDRPLRDLVLSIHSAWASISGAVPESVRTILMHQHILPSNYANHSVEGVASWSFEESGVVWERLFEEFPGMRVVCTVRHPFETAASIWNTMAREHDPVDLSRWFLQQWSLVTAPRLLDSLMRERPDRWRVVHFEDIHRDTVATLRGTREFLGLSDHPCLGRSTILGELWWGNNPARPCNGANPSMAEPAFPRLPERVKPWIASWMRDACGVLGYEVPDGGAVDPSSPLELESWCWAVRRPECDPARLYALPSSERAAFVAGFWELRRRLVGECYPVRLPHPEELPLPWRHLEQDASPSGAGRLVWRLDGEVQASDDEADERWDGPSPGLNPYHWREQLAARLRPFSEVLVRGVDPEWTEIAALSCVAKGRVVRFQSGERIQEVDLVASRGRDAAWRAAVEAAAKLAQKEWR